MNINEVKKYYKLDMTTIMWEACRDKLIRHGYCLVDINLIEDFKTYLYNDNLLCEIPFNNKKHDRYQVKIELDQKLWLEKTKYI